jgi:hypothetical protein
MHFGIESYGYQQGKFDRAVLYETVLFITGLIMTEVNVPGGKICSTISNAS